MMVAPLASINIQMSTRRNRSKSPSASSRSPGSDDNLLKNYAGKTVVLEEQADGGSSRIFDCISTGIALQPTRLQAKAQPIHADFPKHKRISDSIKGWLYAVFLPEGYPASVSSDYLPYQLYDTLQAFCSTITSILAQRAVLQGMGVGNETAKVASALWQTTVRRNIGKVVRITFTAIKGSDMDCNCKTWRIVADVLNDLAMAFELISPILCVTSADCNTQWTYFAWVCAAEVFRSIVGVSGGASRAALTQHFSLRDNFGDVNAKDGSQEMFVEIMGSAVGMLVSDYAKEHDNVSKWALFLFFTALHIFANVMACTAVCLLTFNRQRVHIVVDHWLKTRQVLTPYQVAARESVIHFGGSGIPGVDILLGVGVRELAKYVDIVDMIRSSQGAPFIVCEVRSKGWFSSRRKILVGLKVGVTHKDILLAYTYAYMLAKGTAGMDARASADDLVKDLAGGGWTRDVCHVAPSAVRLRWRE